MTSRSKCRPANSFSRSSSLPLPTSPAYEPAQPLTDIVCTTALPPSFPTQAHSPAFWEALGRAVATVGFLEETLGKAIFAYTGMRERGGWANLNSPISGFPA
jgi:hypothetical protein